MEDAVCWPLLTLILSPLHSPLQRFPHEGSQLLEEAEATAHNPCPWPQGQFRGGQ